MKAPCFFMWRRASTRATKAPVMEAVRVPPSAWMHVAVDPERALAQRLQVHHRAQRAADQPLDLVRAAGGPALRRPRAGCGWWSRAGSIPYSEVIQPSPWPLRKGGTRSSTLTVQITRVSPTSMSAEPSACLLYRGVMVTGRSWSGARPSLRMLLPSRFSSAGSICSLKSPMRKLKALPPAPTPSAAAGAERVEAAVVLAVGEDGHHVAPRLHERDALDELLRRHVGAARRPGDHPARPRIVRRQRALHASPEAVRAAGAGTCVPSFRLVSGVVQGARLQRLLLPEAAGDGAARCGGMTCISPRAPALLTAAASKVDSCQDDRRPPARDRAPARAACALQDVDEVEGIEDAPHGVGQAVARRAGPLGIGPLHGRDGGAQPAPPPFDPGDRALDERRRAQELQLGQRLVEAVDEQQLADARAAASRDLLPRVPGDGDHHRRGSGGRSGAGQAGQRLLRAQAVVLVLEAAAPSPRAAPPRARSGRARSRARPAQ